MKYSELVEVYEELESNPKRLAKTKIISELFRKTPSEEINVISLLVQGKLFPSASEDKIGVSTQYVIKAIEKATGFSNKKVVEEFRKKGDLGLVAEELINQKKQRTLFGSEKLTVKKVFENLKRLVEIEGSGSVDKKVGLISELLTSANPKEAKYIIKTVLELLRIGVGDGSVRDALVWAFFHKEVGLKYDEKGNKVEYNEEYNKYTDAVQKAYDLTGDFGDVAYLIKTKGFDALHKVEISIGTAIKVMLGPKEETMKDAIERVGLPCAVEYKLDGFRLQIHKNRDKINLYTRSLDNVSKQFPDVVSFVRDYVKADKCILDSEAVGYDSKTKKYKPFQEISQRIKRKYDIEKLAKEVPVEVNVFDVMVCDGEICLDKPFKERKKLLKKIINGMDFKLKIVEGIEADSEKEAEKFYKQSLNAGNEGVMFKNLEAVYVPGARVGNMVKFKPVQEPFDLVIVGADYGTGKRSGGLSSFTVACRDDNGKFLPIGKVGTGFKEVSDDPLNLDNMTKLIKPFITKTKGTEVEIKPKIVIEVAYEEIQKSPSYESGYALRFPRVIRLREDRGAEECSTLEDIEFYYKKQRRR